LEQITRMKIFKYIALTLFALLVIFFCIGVFNRQIHYTNTIEINASPQKSFALFADTNRMKEWMPGFQSFKKISGTDMQKGSKWKLILMQEGAAYDMTETIIEVKQGEQYSFHLENAVLTNKVDMFFKPSGSKTELTVNNTVAGNNIFWSALFFFFKSGLEEKSQMMYVSLKDMIEKEN
jgi:carbon monoxide dehydrogenase subunit G